MNKAQYATGVEKLAANLKKVIAPKKNVFSGKDKSMMEAGTIKIGQQTFEKSLSIEPEYTFTIYFKKHVLEGISVKAEE